MSGPNPDRSAGVPRPATTSTMAARPTWWPTSPSPGALPAIRRRNPTTRIPTNSGTWPPAWATLDAPSLGTKQGGVDRTIHQRLQRSLPPGGSPGRLSRSAQPSPRGADHRSKLLTLAVLPESRALPRDWHKDVHLHYSEVDMRKTRLYFCSRAYLLTNKEGGKCVRGTLSPDRETLVFRCHAVWYIPDDSSRRSLSRKAVDLTARSSRCSM